MPPNGAQMDTLWLQQEATTLSACSTSGPSANWNLSRAIRRRSTVSLTPSFRCYRSVVAGIEWHPVHHNHFVTGDAAGAINFWSLSSPDPSVPVTSLAAAHEDAVFSLSFHPLGHVLCSGSKDYTARFWSRARPPGGHETDRWHLGEREAMEVRRLQEAEREERAERAARERDREAQERDTKRARTDDGPPGLRGLPGLGALQGLANSLSGLPGLNGGAPPGGSGGAVASGGYGQGAPSLPGLGGYGRTNGAGGPPGFSGGGGAGMGGQAGGMRRGGPLPSQQDMLRMQDGVAPGQDGGGGSGGYGRGGGSGSGGYGGGRYGR